MLCLLQAIGVTVVLGGDPPARPIWENTQLAGSPDPPLAYTVDRVFAEVELPRPIFLAEEPDDSGYLLVVLQGGEAEQPSRIVRLKNDAAVVGAESYFEFPQRLIYSLTFDPDYRTNRSVYLFHHGPVGQKQRSNRISRFQVAADPAPHLDVASEQVIIDWDSAGHDGGGLAFGPDGMLYITTGDGSSDSDERVSGQTLDDLSGGVLRIDVRGAGRSAEKPYLIPDDNPFVDLSGARPEIWAYGLRNPWRMSIDRQSGQIWVGNNGQDLWETAHLVRAGENYGWSVYEGAHPFFANRQLGPTPHVAPTIEHPHSEFRSLTGGVVYRGARWPELDGAYIYGDYSTGQIWGARHDGSTMLWHRKLADTSLQIAAFAIVGDGELIVVDNGGGLYRMQAVPQAELDKLAAQKFPAQLSETGLFLPDDLIQPAAGVIGYSVNASAWNDGATAQRWMAIPGDGHPSYNAGAGWGFPDGTALVQTLSLEAEVGNPESRIRIETRVQLRQQGEWAGYSYRWNDDQTQAELVPGEGATAEIVIRDSSAPGGTRHQAWRFPSRAECAMCHSRAATYVLGTSGAQLQREHDYGGSTGLKNQLQQLAAMGVLESAPDLPGPQVNPYADDQDIDARARSYLHVNCSHCHVEAGGGNARMDLRLVATQNAMGVFDARPQHTTFGISDAMLVAPGDAARSVLHQRITRRGDGQMPPLASSQIDRAGAELISQWIAAMPASRSSVHAWAMSDLTDELANGFAGSASASRTGSGRSFLSGKQAFTKTGCVQCHRLAGEGGSVGPDLTDLVKGRSPLELLDAILNPSAQIADPKFAIPGSAPAVSLMPAGMVNVLEKDDLLDLLYYLWRGGRPKVAAIVTEYRHNSHADIIVSRLLQTDTLDGKGRESPLELVSLYTDQVPASDISRALSSTHGFTVFPTIAGALTLGSGKLAVDGVLLIAEHGDYPKSATGNTVYPKRRFWDETIGVFKASGRQVPVFIDKHLADNWADARFIYDSARELQIPLMAGSSLPTSWRYPPDDVEHGAQLSEIVAITYHTTDAYGFHALEFIQALAEQRRGGETGIRSVQAISGDDVWRAFDEGASFDGRLFDAAWSRLSNPTDKAALRRAAVAQPRLFVIEHADGLRVYLFELNGAVGEWSAAWRYHDAAKPIGSSLFWTQEGRPGMHFTWLLNGVENMILSGRPSWPVERTLVTSGTLDALLTSLTDSGKLLETPQLMFPYKSDWRWHEPPPPPPMRPWAEQ